MGWEPARLLGPEFLILSTHGGMRAQDGTPIALGFHTGHWEVGLLVAEAARELRNLRCGAVCRGAAPIRATAARRAPTGMLDSLPYRNDAAMVLRRLMRSLPTREGVIGVATCDKGLPAMMMALASSGDVAEHAGSRRRDAAAGERRGCRQGADHRRTLCAGADHAGVCRGDGMPRVRDAGRRLPVSGDGGDFAGGGRGAGTVAAACRAGAFGPADLAGCGDALGARVAADGAARHRHERCADGRGHSQCDGAARGVWRIDESAAACAGDCARGRAAAANRVRIGRAINRAVPRLVDALPNGPKNFATVQVFLAGGVPEVMLHLRRAGLLDTACVTVTGETLGRKSRLVGAERAAARC